MPRRYQPRAPMTTTDGRLDPQWEWLLRDLMYVPEWVKATEQRTLKEALATTALVTTPVEQVALYQISYYARIVEPATVSSSLTVTVTWTEQGVTQTYTAPAMTGNTTDSAQNNTGILITADAGTEVSVDTSYASVGANDMAYDLDVSVEPSPTWRTWLTGGEA